MMSHQTLNRTIELHSRINGLSPSHHVTRSANPVLYAHTIHIPCTINQLAKVFEHSR
ncbi:hypothetical protein K493DRAFT_16955 [Basidiobolus meristosporus CBS 931.73]|uniref:Uncharacterized protein n=1 Tax=Basidiobolus meristosporus CBS 931.73 TaxID=1314790 RepID=A0A1Y1YFV8_9FUNG|nr:hypothetical protein K493DRAFT_16955 [Basidiobolus meristosporus CBS 931.73]|eukprot:ORX96865.1 hypothetical protein K493DRAFT_16955 [Basidiobolus meristosporus CBS 931.73]